MIRSQNRGPQLQAAQDSISVERGIDTGVMTVADAINALALALRTERGAANAAKMLGVTQPKVSALRHYKLAGFSVERLMNLLTALDHDVEIVIRRKPRSRKAARISVVAA